MGRRDDIISIIYVLVYISTKFKFFRISMAEMKQFKLGTSASKFCFGTNLGPILEYAYNLGYEE